MSSSSTDHFLNYLSIVHDIEQSALPVCKYFTEVEFNEAFLSRGCAMRRVSIFHINIRSLNANHYKLQQLMISLKYSFDIIVLTEIWAFNIMLYQNLLPDYNFLFTIPSSSKIGGVGMYINNSFEIIERKDLNFYDIDHNDDFENLFLELHKNNYKCIIGGIYRHPSQNIASFLTSCEKYVASVKMNDKTDHYLIGDINQNLLNYDTNRDSSNFLDIMLSYNFLPLTTLHTRVTETSSTLIDHIFYRAASNTKKTYLDNLFTGVLVIDISDHLANFIILTTPNIKNKKIADIDRPLIRVFSSKNNLIFNNKFSLYDWNMLFSTESDVNKAYDVFITAVQTVYNEAYPLVKLSRKRAKDKKWVTQEVIKASDCKNKLYKRWIVSKSLLDKSKYQEYKKVYNKILKTAEKSYYRLIFDSTAKSTKSLWSEINKLCCTVKKKSDRITQISKVIINNRLITDSVQISNEFNSYFCGLGEELANKLPSSSVNFNYSSYLEP